MTAQNKQFWKNRKVLVTGHEGFLGSWLTKTLIEAGADVVGLDRVLNRKKTVLNGHREKLSSIKGDVANLKLVREMIERQKTEYIFHLAAEAIVGTANKYTMRTFKSNIQGTWNILEAAKRCPFVKGIVVASSDKAYGEHKKLPYTEEAALKGDHPYDVSKSCADLICYTYFKSFHVPVCVTRCGNIYGPGDFNKSRLIPDAIAHSLRGEQFKIRSDGKFTRDYIFVKDIVDAYLLLAESMNKEGIVGEAFNFSYETPLSVLDVFMEVEKSAGGPPIKPKVLNEAKMEIPHQYLSSKKAKELLGWRPRYSLSEGLKETISWYKDHMN